MSMINTVGRYDSRCWNVEFTTTDVNQTVSFYISTAGFIRVNWGDGVMENRGVGASSHTYASAGVHTAKISGYATALDFDTTDSHTRLTRVYPISGLVLKSAADMFRECTGLTAIPVGLFNNCTGITNFQYAFYACTGLTEIPSDLFRYNVAALNFGYTFYGCANITEIPDNLFRYNTLATSFQGAFAYCSGLTVLPTDLFRYNTLATNFAYCLMVCTGLTAIPATLFTANTAVTTYQSTFFNCGSTLDGNAPELWNLVPAPTGTNCFTTCTGLDNYASIPAGWK